MSTERHKNSFKPKPLHDSARLNSGVGFHMSTLSTDITNLIAEAEKLLLEPPTSAVKYSDMHDLRNNTLPAEFDGKSINLYALWVRGNPSEQWRCMYIGQRKQKKAWSRVREHLFHTPKGTQSKLAELAEQLRNGRQIGITGVLVEPDSIRLAVEEELIYRNASSETGLPWNNKGRKVPLPAIRDTPLMSYVGRQTPQD